VGQRRGAQAAAKLRSVLAFTVGTREGGQRIAEQEIEDAILQLETKVIGQSFCRRLFN
jgi:hypothetical protein